MRTMLESSRPLVGPSAPARRSSACPGGHTRARTGRLGRRGPSPSAPARQRRCPRRAPRSRSCPALRLAAPWNRQGRQSQALATCLRAAGLATRTLSVRRPERSTTLQGYFQRTPMRLSSLPGSCLQAPLDLHPPAAAYVITRFWASLYIQNAARPGRQQYQEHLRGVESHSKEGCGGVSLR